MRASARGLGLLPTTHDFGSTPHSGNGVDLCSFPNRAIGIEDASITHWVTRTDLSSNANRANGSQSCSIAQWVIGSGFDSTPELSNFGEFVSAAHWVNRTDLCPSAASARTNVTSPCGELAREARKARQAQKQWTRRFCTRWRRVHCHQSLIRCPRREFVPAYRTPWHGARAQRGNI